MKLFSHCEQCTKNIFYEPKNLPETLYKKTVNLLTKFLTLLESNSHKKTSHTLAVGGVLPRPANINSRNIEYGFKGPISMTLAPFFALLLNDFRILHVLRDGRDIAFSANQVRRIWINMYICACSLLFVIFIVR